jgi:hypothetical protein
VTFDDWIDQLRADGMLLCPSSSAVPVELTGLRPDGTGFHFRCRGVRIRLALFRPGRASWQVPLWDERWSPEEGLSLWAHRPATADDAVDVTDVTRLVFDAPDRPDRLAVLDGADEWGWGSYEAGLLAPAAASVLFDRLTAVLDDAADDVFAGAAAPGRCPAAGSERHVGAGRTGPSLLVPHARAGEPAFDAARLPAARSPETLVG